MPFEKGNKLGKKLPQGKSGNPGGRPALSTPLEANGYTTEQARALWWKRTMAILKKGPRGTSDSVFRTAYVEAGARLVPKPKETVDLNLGGPSEQQTSLLAALVLTPHERRQRLQRPEPSSTAVPSAARDRDDDADE